MLKLTNKFSNSCYELEKGWISFYCYLRGGFNWYSNAK